ncbi:c-type cytochrome [Bradyrhizobium sp.]|uniref:c-type cytochrome n=1 Tax=Bradyrhizobium sp. TaxID=376 RepID=UPI003C3C3CE2
MSSPSSKVSAGIAVTVAAVCSLLLLSSAAAQKQADFAPQDRPVAKVADLMIATQARHIKLWFAGKLLNWKLASYELDLVRAKLQEAATLSPSPGAAPSEQPMQSLQRAIDAHDAVGFTNAYTELTNACNACHHAVDRSFISIRVPVTSPFGDELFVDQVAEGRGLAHLICGACHVVAENSNEVPVSKYPAPSFPDLARRPAFTEDALRQLLSSNHRNLGQDQTMRNPRLGDDQIEDIIAYFAALRAKDSPR